MTTTLPVNTVPPLAIRLFGPFEALVHGAPLPHLRSRKGYSLFALLTLRHGTEVERAWLAGTLWPDSPDAQAFASLRNSLKDLRHALGPEAGRLHSPTPRTLTLDLSGAEADVLVFDAAVARGDEASLERAVALYRGPLLEGCREEWVFQERHARQQACLGALERLAAKALERGDPAPAEAYLRRAVAVEPLRESAQRALMRALAAGGNYTAASLVYRELRVLLHREHHTEPDPATSALFQEIRAEARRRAEAPSPTGNRNEPVLDRHHSPEPGDAGPGNLPRPLTSFVGRETEIAAVQRQLADTSLLTLTGAGGCGKSRLALRIAADLVTEYPEGVWLAELSSLTDPARVPQAVADALGVREEPRRSLLATLMDALRGQSLLLLDNCEHLLAACASLVESLLQSCPRLRILATSREALGIPGEQPYRVPSLSLPDLEPLPTDGEKQVSAVLRSEAGRLFVSRAVIHQPEFVATAQNAPAVAYVCRRLDGLPLAIELAAARMRLLTVEQLAERLEDRFRLLTGGSQTALPRHRTLRSAIDWSYDLLTEGERALLRRLSVFAGGFTLVSAEAVCVDGVRDARCLQQSRGGADRADGAAVGDRKRAERLATGSPSDHGPGFPRRHSSEAWDTVHCPPDEVLDPLTQLVDKSLVMVEPQRTGSHRAAAGFHAGAAGRRECRYRLLDTIRQYAGERLEELGEAELFRRRHRDWFLQLAEEAEPRLPLAAHGEWLERLDAEHDNLRAALACSVERGEVAIALRLAGALRQFWMTRGHWEVGLECLKKVLDWPGAEERAAARVKALTGAGLLAWRRGDFATAEVFHQESLAMAQELEDPQWIATSLENLGLVATGKGEYAAAQALFRQCLTIKREMGNLAGVVVTLGNLGALASHQGDNEQAWALQMDRLALCRELGDEDGIAFALESLATVAQARGDARAARSMMEESLAIQRERCGCRGCLGVALGRLAVLVRSQGDHEAARALLEECLAIAREIDSRPGIALVLRHLGEVAQAQGDTEKAEALHRQSLAIQKALGLQRDVAETLHSLAKVVQARGDPAEARALYQRSLVLFRDTGNKPAVLTCLERLAAVAEAQEPGERSFRSGLRSARLFGAAAALREALGVPRVPADRAGYESDLATARGAVGEEAFAAAWTEGRALSLEAAIADALAPHPPVAEG